MKTILCYGDSNTYGYNPSDGMRYPEDVRWPGRLRNLLGDDYRVVEEGCNGRTTVFDDPAEGWKNGISYLRPCLNSHKPLDLVILMLGSNDLKEIFHADAEDSAEGVKQMIRVIQEFMQIKQGYVPQILLISPPRIGEDIVHSPFFGSFSETAPERSEKFSVCFRNVAEECGCFFLDAAGLISPSELDSLHLSPEGHKKLSDEVFRQIKTIM